MLEKKFAVQGKVVRALTAILGEDILVSECLRKSQEIPTPTSFSFGYGEATTVGACTGQHSGVVFLLGIIFTWTCIRGEPRDE